MALPRLIILGLILTLAACGGRDREVTLTRLTHDGDGPDEFSILPGKPLQAPEDYASLPAPAPGAANLTDPTPKADSVAALGGNRAVLASSGVSAGDASLVRHSRRYGADSAIRQTLRVEDTDVRRRHGRVNILKIGPRDDYTDAYRRQWLDSQGETARLRRLGIETPSAPPPR